MPFYDQSMHSIRCEWGTLAIDHLAQADVTIIVDVLSFSTCVDVAVSRGTTIYPYAWKDETARSYAASLGAVVAGNRDGSEKYSLSPASLSTIPKGTKLVLPSPNGSYLTLKASQTGAVVLLGSLRNAKAVADYAQLMGSAINVIPAGERWADNSLRPAWEDALGAGAIISYLTGSRSPEAKLQETAFQAALPDLPRLIADCASGRELIERGFEKDVEMASALNESRAVPRLTNEGIINAVT